MSERKIVCRVLTGPTASGKSEIGLRLAEEMGWEILCMDSMQIYRRMDIGTAKPTSAEQARVRHHLLDLCEPTDSFSVSDYVKAAEDKIRELAGKGQEGILFIGGTGLYLAGMIHPLALGSVPANEKLREELNREAGEPDGKARLHRELEKIDPETAARLPLNDIRRTIRAIEVTLATGIPFSKQPEREERSPFDWKIVSTAMERERLYRRINERVEGMMQNGLAEEVRALLNEGVPDDAQSMSAIGYKETVPYVRGESTLEETINTIQTNTRHYAKRQMTFLRRETGVQYVPVENDGAYEAIKRALA